MSFLLVLGFLVLDLVDFFDFGDFFDLCDFFDFGVFLDWDREYEGLISFRICFWFFCGGFFLLEFFLLFLFLDLFLFFFGDLEEEFLRLLRFGDFDLDFLFLFFLNMIKRYVIKIKLSFDRNCIGVY